MPDRIGVLGEASAVTTGTHAAYICPSGKAAKVTFMYRGVAGVNSTLAVLVNGIVLFTAGPLTSGDAQISTKTEAHVAAPTNDGNGADSVVAPAPYSYYLSEGDSVQYTIGTANFASMNFQVVGAEVSVS